jgi:hypothetical protein
LLSLQFSPSLSFKQRTCIYARELISPQFAFGAAMVAAFDQYRNSPHVEKQHLKEFPYRLGVYYSRHAARDSGELLVGYLHHEDPRFRRNGTGTFWQRANSAFLNVLTSPAEDGSLRPALAPIAGSLSSAVVGTVMYRHSETLPNIATRAAFVYGHYFLTAIFSEFKPDIASFTQHLLHHDKN